MADATEAAEGLTQPLLSRAADEVRGELSNTILSRPTSPRLCGGAPACGLSAQETGPSDLAERQKARRKLISAIGLCLVFMIVEVSGGFLSNSLAIMTDAAHLLSDIAGFAISLFAIWMAGWEATPKHSFGYHRMEILGAFFSVQLIWSITGIIVYEAVVRLLNKGTPVDGRLMFFTATFGVCVNVIMLSVFEHGHSHSHGDGHGHSHGGGGHGHSHCSGGTSGKAHISVSGGHAHGHGEGGRNEGGHKKNREHRDHGDGQDSTHVSECAAKHGEAIHSSIRKASKQGGESVVVTIEGDLTEAHGSPAHRGKGSGVKRYGCEEHGHGGDSDGEHTHMKEGHRDPDDENEGHERTSEIWTAETSRSRSGVANGSGRGNGLVSGYGSRDERGHGSGHGHGSGGENGGAEADRNRHGKGDGKCDGQETGSRNGHTTRDDRNGSGPELAYETRLPVEELLHLTDRSSDGRRLGRRLSSHADVRPPEERNINLRGAYLHALGDLVQSVGVMVAGLVIWFFPEWQIVDLICTLLFSVLVLATTVHILRDILEVLLESTPRAINAEELEERIMKVASVVDVHDLHIWQITMGKTLLACHLRIDVEADPEDVLLEVTELCERKYGIEHVTIQVEKAWAG